MDRMEQAHKRIRIFTNKYPNVGPTFWVVTVQYFIIQAVAMAYWLTPTSYSLRHNPISDLGNTMCGEYATRYVCSPLHDWMNASFILLGLLMIAGSTLLYEEFRKNVGSAIGFVLMAIAGFGTILVGVFPENTISQLHFLGALLVFLLGNIALVIFGFALNLHGWFRVFTIACGVISLIALPLFYFQIYLGLGEGGMERVVAYPQTIWLIFFGLYMTRNRFKSAARKLRSKIRY